MTEHEREQAIKAHQEQTAESRKSWPPGPWMDEPDRIEFEHAGLPCVLSRNPGLGNWCGYVGVGPGHPWYRKDDVEAEVHGGLTYADKCEGPVCHRPKPGESDNVWWLGFDCAHAGDLVPGLGAWFPLPVRETYRDAQWVRAAVEYLADQAKAAVGK